MHPHAALLEKLYTSLDRRDHAGMAECYHPDAEFRDIAFTLKGREIHAMWHLISETDIRASFTIRRVDEDAGVVDLLDMYTFEDKGILWNTRRPVQNVIRSEFKFRDRLIIEHADFCSELHWGVQALGTVKGVITWRIPAIRRAMAMKKLEKFIAKHQEYATTAEVEVFLT